MTKKIVFVVLVTVLLSGCMSLHVKNNIDYPERVFERTAKKIEAIHAKDPLRKGKIHKLNLLVYDGEDREMVKLSVRKWFAKLILKNAIQEDEEDKIGNIMLKNIKNLKNIGPGLLIEVRETEENTHLLLWID